jgi:hypothetical protein
MDFYEALGVAIELAEDNIVDLLDADTDADLKEQREFQLSALEAVGNGWIITHMELAAVLKEAREAEGAQNAEPMAAELAITGVTRRIADHFAKRSTAFDRAEFYIAAGAPEWMLTL